MNAAVPGGDAPAAISTKIFPIAGFAEIIEIPVTQNTTINA